MSARRLRVATRGSALARWQTQHVIEQLDCECEEVIIASTGDKDQTASIASLRAQGAFVKELQHAVIDGRADFAVHSAKDLPAVTDPELFLAAIPKRADARDVLVGSRLSDLPEGARIGTGSLRRRAQLSAKRPDLVFEELRGNIDTRLSKAKNFDAIVLAAAGIERLGRSDEITEYLPTETVLPQVGQGALAVECRAGDNELIETCRKIEHVDSRRAVDTERSFLAQLGGACNLPEGAYAVVDGESIRLKAVLSSIDGKTCLRYELEGADGVQLGIDVANYILEELDGKSLLDTLRTEI